MVEPKPRSARSRVRAVADAVDLLALVTGLVTGEGAPSIRGLGSAVVILPIALVGVGTWFGVIAVAGLVIVAFGLGDGPYAGLGGAVAVAGFLGGIAAAAIVMTRIVRRHRKLVAAPLFGDDDPPIDSEVHSKSDAAPIARSPATSGFRPRELDARLAASATNAPATEERDRGPGPAKVPGDNAAPPPRSSA
jgi:hypothetical protein